MPKEPQLASNTHTATMIESPFNLRHCCWFCGEPKKDFFIFPNQSEKHLLLTCPHPVIATPCCAECHPIASKAEANSIWAVNRFVKQQLIKRHAKDLAIGLNWTEQELATSEFEGGNFEGFARSAWFIYEVAKTRVNYQGWSLVINGIELDESLALDAKADEFTFDGVLYPSINDAIDYYCEVFLLDKDYLTEVLYFYSDKKVSSVSFAKAVRFCRLLVNANKTERMSAFKALTTKS